MKEDIENKLSEIFKVKGFCMMKLPNGWIGRPFDNYYYFKSVSFKNKLLMINFTTSSNLEVYEPEVLQLENEIIFRSNGKITYNNIGSGDGQLHVSNYDKGDVHFYFR